MTSNATKGRVGTTGPTGDPSSVIGGAGSPSPGHGRAGSPSPADGNCQQQLLELSAYLEGDLTPTKMAELDAHLANCDCCGRMAASLRRAIALCRSHEARELPPDVKARALDRVRALLATPPPER